MVSRVQGKWFRGLDVTGHLSECINLLVIPNCRNARPSSESPRQSSRV